MQRSALWKVRRELKRGLASLWDRTAHPLRRIRTFLYDHGAGARIDCLDGLLPVTTRIAIFVIFQPAGLKPSVLQTCEWLAASGYAPMVVSNAPLSQKDRDALASCCWKIAERPNVGYDFGAYRDGLKLLARLDQRPERLVLLNDSIWVPIAHSADILPRLEAASPIMSGPVFVSHEGRSARNAHFQSFLLSFGKQALEDAAFTRFWSRYPLSDTRRVVLAAGEKGLTQSLLTAGLLEPFEPTARTMVAALAGLSSTELAEILSYAAYNNPRDTAEGRALLLRSNRDDHWRHDALTHFRTMLRRSQAMGAFPVAGVRLLGLGFLKKGTNLPIYSGMRWQYLRAVRDGVLPAPSPEILAEIEASPMDGRWTTDPKVAPPK